MTHTEIENQAVVERYVDGKLGATERHQFQEHFFTCDECFANVQTAERFRAGIRNAAEDGLLDEAALKRPAGSYLPDWHHWLKPALAVAVLATMVVTAILAWLVFVRLPELREEVAHEREARKLLEKQSQNEIDERFRQQQSSPAPLEQSTASNENSGHKTPSANRTKDNGSAELLAQNTPVVTLQATRSVADTNQLYLPVGARHFVCWIEVAPQTRFASYRVEVFNVNRDLVATVGGLKKNSHDAVVLSLPAEKFASGDYLVKLSGMSESHAVLVGEYKLQLEKR